MVIGVSKDGLVETGSAAVKGKIYTVGGQEWAPQPDGGGNFRVSDKAYMFDPVGNTWSKLAPYPGDKVDHPGLAAVGDDLYLVGGMKGTADGQTENLPGNVPGYPDFATSEVRILDTDTGKWRMGPPLPAPRGAGVLRAEGKKLYFAGGIDERIPRSDLFMLDTEQANPQWVRLALMKHARDHITGEFLDGKFYVIGGRYGFQTRDNQTNPYSQFILFGYNECYDPATNTWTDKAELLPKRGALSSGILAGRIVVFGGEFNGSKIFNNTAAYDASSDSWAELPGMITGRHGTHGVTVGNWIYSTGGAPDWGVPTWDNSTGRYTYFGSLWGPVNTWTTSVTVNEAFGVDPPLAARTAGATASATR